MPPPILEVIVQSAADARAAAEGGADRLEVVQAIDRGGLTPLVSVVEAIGAATMLPLRVMVRENDGFELLAGELPALRRAAAAFVDAGVDGIVIGFATNGEILLDDLLRVVDGLPPVRITFHRAFDSLRDPPGAIPRLAAVGNIDRILTSGGDGAPLERCARLTRYRAVAAGGLEIIAGGGVDEHALSLFVREGCVRELHVGRAAREGDRADGPVSAARVRHLKKLVASGLGTRD